MKRSEQINELAAALSKAQSEMKDAVKDKINPHFKNAYASLGATWAVARGPLSKNGLSLLQTPSTTEQGLLKITTLLMHSSGQWVEDELVLTPRDQSPQSMGSATSYGRRYALAAFLGITSDEDDDGELASHSKPIYRSSATATATLNPVSSSPEVAPSSGYVPTPDYVPLTHHNKTPVKPVKNPAKTPIKSGFKAPPSASVGYPDDPGASDDDFRL